jgi:hemolysin activation/secretion protein
MDTRKKIHAITAALLILCALIMASPVYSQQQIPNIGEALKEAAPPPKEAREKPPEREAPLIVQEAEPFSMPEGKTIFVKDFKVEGALPADNAALSALLDPYKNKELSMAQIMEAASKVTLFYRDKGYLVARAYVPKQDASGGILTIQVLMGSYGAFSLKNTSLVRDFLIRGAFDKAKQASPVVTRDSVERAMMVVRDMPGSTLPTLAISPGALPGTSDFAVSADKGPRINGYFMGDNQGSHFTGKNRVYGGIDINSPFGFADKFSVSGMTSNGEGLQNIRLAYGLPLAYNGLRADFAASRTTYQLGGVFSDLDAKGSADILEGTLSYPLRKTRDETIDISLNIAYKELRDDLQAVDSTNPRDAAVATLALQRTAFRTLFGRNFFTTMSAGVNLGTLSIRDDTQKALNDAGANTSGTFSKLNLSFLGNLTLSEKFSARGSLKLQKVLTAHNLDPSEQFFINGMAGVKAYTESVSFDNGYVANMELRYALPAFPGLNHALGVFVDNGYVYAQNGDFTEETRAMITDVGVGYYMSYKQVFGSVQLAEPIGGTWNRNVTDPGTRILAQVGMVF